MTSIIITNSKPVRVAILAGGLSTRMGRDKASLIVGGETLLNRTIRIALTVSDTPLIVGRALPDGSDHEAAHFVPDDEPGLGPVGGLRTAFRQVSGCDLLALSCDLPLLTGDALRWLITQRRGEYGVVTRNAGQWEPLFAVYSLTCLPILDANIADGKRSLHALIRAGGDGFALADGPPEVAAALANVNTPEDWNRVLGN